MGWGICWATYFHSYSPRIGVRKDEFLWQCFKTINRTLSHKWLKKNGTLNILVWLNLYFMSYCCVVIHSTKYFRFSRGLVAVSNRARWTVQSNNIRVAKYFKWTIFSSKYLCTVLDWIAIFHINKCSLWL